MLGEAHRHEHGAAAGAAQDVGPGDQVRQAFLDRLAHFLVVAQPVARAAREEVVPADFGGDAQRRLPAGEQGSHGSAHIALLAESAHASELRLTWRSPIPARAAW